MYRISNSLPLIPVLLTLLLSACGGPSGPDDTEPELLEQAWQLYLIGDWSEALVAFSELIDDPEQAAEAYTGCGYCQLHLHLPVAAAASFNSALNLNQWLQDSRAGLIFATRELAEVDYTSLRADAVELLTLNPDWVFAPEPAINRLDLLLVRAQCAFYLGDFEDCLQALHEINPELTLEESDQASWNPWTTFTEALFHTLAEYSLLYGDMEE